MREILFRGFHRDENGTEKVFVNGEWVKGTWVYGFYVHYDDVVDCHLDDCDYIVERHNGKDFIFNEVITETVGQYVGLKDKNGKKIFDGDIIKHYNGCDIKEYSVDTGRVFFYPQTMRYLRTSTLFPDDCPEIYDNNEYEVIGNIFENPELWEKN